MGEEVLSAGPDEPRRFPPAVVVVVVLLGLFAAVQGVRELADRDRTPGPGPRPPVRAATPAVPERLAEPTGVSLLIGGTALVRVDVDSGRVTPFDPGWQRPADQVTSLVDRPAGQVALLRDGDSVAWLLPRRGPALRLGPAAAVAPVGASAVALSRPVDGRVEVRTVELSPAPRSGPPVLLPAGTRVVGGVPGRLLAEVPDGGTPALRYFDQRTGAAGGFLARPGHALAADGYRVAWLRAGCADQCLIRLTDLRTVGDPVIAVLGEQVAAAAVAPDGRVAMTAPVRFAVMGSREPALVVGGTAPFVIRTAPLSGLAASLAWSPDGRWVFLLDPGGTDLLAWRRDSGTVFRVPVDGRLPDRPALLAAER